MDRGGVTCGCGIMWGVVGWGRGGGGVVGSGFVGWSVSGCGVDVEMRWVW